MKKINKLIAVFALMAFLLLPTQSAQAQGPDGGGKVVFGENFTLESGETLEGDLVVFGGNVKIEEDAVVEGSVVVFGGNIDLAENASINSDTAMIGGTMDISGVVDGDIFILGGQVSLTDTAIVHGDIAAMGGEIKRDAKAQVDGDILENVPAPTVDIPDLPTIPNVPNVPDVPPPPDVRVDVNPLWEPINVVFRALAVAALAMLLALFLQPQLERVSDAVIRQPVLAGSFGMLTAVVAPFVIVIMVVTLILIPVALLAAILLPLMWLFGVIALGQEVGERFTKAINQSWAPVLTAGFGAFLLMLVGGFIGMIPCVGWLAPFLIGLMGIGGVVMTWFGSRFAPGTMAQPVEVPPAS
ncbi:MAG: polymer-forming cytoskeletal protein [Chloroflexi bacterium]|nr:polymer-forming cytoskeletal protein [Chloroflexota bacterium]